MRNVITVVPVLTQSCQSDEKLKSGPVSAHTKIDAAAPRNAQGLPTMLATVEAIRVNQWPIPVAGTFAPMSLTCSRRRRSVCVMPLDHARRVPPRRPSKGWPTGTGVDEAFRRDYPTTPNAELATRYNRSQVTIMKWARALGLRKDAAYRCLVQARNASQRRLTAEQRRHLGDLRRGRKLAPGVIEKIMRTKRERGTILRGVSHPFWKGGRPWERFKDPAYVAWRNAVLARDEFRCQRCGRQCKKHERGLAAHQIQPYATNAALRLELSNGITLCRDCHMTLHGRAPRRPAVISCGCGCGNTLLSIDPYGRPRRFINHHALRGRT